MRSFRLAMIVRKLADLLQSGIPLYRGLGLLAKQSSHAEDRTLLGALQRDVEEGKNFSDALAAYPNRFSPVSVSLVQAGEASGALETILDRLAGLLENETESRQRLLAAMVYPAFLLVLSGMVCIFIVGYVVPRFQPLFQEFGQSLPWPTRFLMAFSGSGVWILGGVLATGLVVIGWATRRSGKSGAFSWLMLAPLIGRALRTLYLERWTFVMSTLLRSGLPLPEALRVSRYSFGSALFTAEIDSVFRRIEEGLLLSSALKEASLFPEDVSEMVAAGEESGELILTFERLAQTFKKESEMNRRVMTAMLEPALVVGMGLLIGFVALAMLLPIMELSGVIR